ncbi:MAG: hypothetical protein Q7S57_02315 [bacterium]|nr:hypothetical protein [bacterium]
MSTLQVFCATFVLVSVVTLIFDRIRRNFLTYFSIEKYIIEKLSPRGTCLSIGELISEFRRSDFLLRKDKLQQILNSLIVAGYVKRISRKHEKFSSLRVTAYRLTDNALTTYDQRWYMVYRRSQYRKFLAA